jgi:hypothetical protein
MGNPTARATRKPCLSSLEPFRIPVSYRVREGLDSWTGNGQRGETRPGKGPKPGGQGLADNG